MKRLLLLLCALPLAAQLPGWWKGLPKLSRLQSDFIQESESAVFGKLQRKGKLEIAQGGRLRVAYEGGLLVVADGHDLIQYDPDTRTAQSLGLKQALKDVPLLSVLLDPARLDQVYRAEAAGGAVVLKPKQSTAPEVRLEGQGAFPRSLSWVDGTGSRQTLRLLNPKVPNTFDPKRFHFQAPDGTRWAN
jgi:outer membrane lipoprotein-sorting protein